MMVKVNVVVFWSMKTCSFLIDTKMHDVTFYRKENIMFNLEFRSQLPVLSAVEPGYNDIGLCRTPSITSDILRYKSVPNC
jgi:hypothetical protein